MRTPARERTEVLAGGRVLLERDVPILVRDGTRLSCDVYRPTNGGRHPAVLEHIPYRKDDLRAWQDRSQNLYLAAHGVACVRLDVRGTGNSEGRAFDEYTLDEQRDGVEAVEWIAGQSWCNGRVGAWGKSYGGFTAIQLAAQQPRALGAIAAVYATDDRYTDDMHFDGGALCAFELSNYPIRMIAMNALPPRGEIDDGAFLARWLARVEETPPWILRWIDEQWDSAYWRNGSLRPSYERIRCPVFVVAGWRDGYRTAGLRMVEGLGVPWQLLAGPWTHVAPDHGRPGPAYPFLHELATWFLHHLAAGPAPDRPRSVFFLAEADPPSPPPVRVSGRWLASDRFPQDRPRHVLHLTADGRLAADAGTASTRLTVPFAPAAGVMNGNWCPPPPDHGLPFDQRADDARSLTFTSAPLGSPVETLGAPTIRLRIEHPGPTALVSVKLTDVTPDGPSVLVTRGILNLAHRRDHRSPDAFSGEADVALPLQATAWRFGSGHRIRIAIAGADWPVAWPPPTRTPISIQLGNGTPGLIELPGLPSDARPFHPSQPPEASLDGGGWDVGHERSEWRIVTDGTSGRSGISASDLWAASHSAQATEVEELHRYEAFASETDPLDVRVTGATSFRVRRPGFDVQTRARGVFTSTADAFVVRLTLQVKADGRTLLRKRWRERILRRLV